MQTRLGFVEILAIAVAGNACLGVSLGRAQLSACVTSEENLRARSATHVLFRCETHAFAWWSHGGIFVDCPPHASAVIIVFRGLLRFMKDLNLRSQCKCEARLLRLGLLL